MGQSRITKAGTPTMGGIVFSLVTFITVIIFYRIYDDIKFDLNTWILIFLPLFGYGLIGFIDDYLIIVRKNNNGLKPKTKLILQILIAGIFFYLYLTQGYSTVIYLTKNIKIDFKWLYGMITFFMLVGGANAVNLADGLDGLAAGLSSFTIATYTFIAYEWPI